MKKILAIFFLIAIIGSGVSTAFAHPFIDQTTPPQFGNVPTGTSQVIIQYSEAIEIDFSSIKVFDSNGEQIDNRDLEYHTGDDSLRITTPPLEDGVYTVTSKVLSRVDGHLVPAAFVFAVGEATIDVTEIPTETKELIFFPEAAARFPGLIGQTIVLGSIIASIFVWGTQRKDSLEISQKFQKFYNQKFMSLIIIGLTITFGSNFIMLAVQTIRLGIPSADVLQTAFGTTLIIRMGITIALLCIYFIMQKKKLFSIKNQIPLLVLSLVLIGTTTMMGHGAASEQTQAIALDYIHNLVSSVWIGGIIFLAFALLPSFAALDQRTKEKWSLIVIPKFSIMVIIGLGVLIISGPALMYLLEDDIGIITQSTYGKLIILKILIASAMIGIGGYHQFGIQKKAEKNIKAFQINKKLRRTLKIESGLGIALLAVVALLTNGTLPAGEIQTADSMQQEIFGLSTVGFSENAKFVLNIEPFSTGPNKITISATNLNGTTLSDLSSIKVKVSNPSKGISPIEIPLEQKSTPTSDQTLMADYQGEVSFGFSDNWQLDIEAQRTHSANEIITLDLLVKPSLANLKTEIIEYELPETSSPLYPIYDHNTDTIWISDASAPRIWSFSIQDKTFKKHNFEGQTSITLDIDNDGKIWFTDIAEGRIGFFDQSTDTTEIIELPNIIPIIQRSLPITLDTDADNNIWITIANKNVLLKYDQTTKQFQEFKLPTKDSGPFAVKVDPNDGKIWFTLQTVGKLGYLDPNTKQIKEFSPPTPLAIPETITIDHDGNLWIAEHQENGAITKFNPILETFEKIPVNDAQALPNGAILDKYQNVWFAQHTVDELGVYDPHKLNMIKIPLPTTQTWVQFTTSDSQNNIWFVEQKPYKLGMVKITETPNLATSIDDYSDGDTQGIISLRYSEIAAPLISAGIIATSLFFVKSIKDRRRINSLLLSPSSEQKD
jgi:copper transport protein